MNVTEWQEREVLRALRSAPGSLKDWEVIRLTRLDQATVRDLLVRLEQRGVVVGVWSGGKGVPRRREYRLKQAGV